MNSELASIHTPGILDGDGRVWHDANEPYADGQDLFGLLDGDSMLESARRKELGAYYTDVSIASFLLRWAVKTGQETVLDPSSGDGVFLSEAARRIRDLGGNGPTARTLDS